MKTDTRTKGGLVSAYGFACGYIESASFGSVNIRLWREHGVYHVRAHCTFHGRRFWESFGLLADARRHMNHARALLLAAAL